MPLLFIVLNKLWGLVFVSKKLMGDTGPGANNVYLSVVKSMVLKDTRALGPPEEAWSPCGPIWGESIRT